MQKMYMRYKMTAVLICTDNLHLSASLGFLPKFFKSISLHQIVKKFRKMYSRHKSITFQENYLLPITLTYANFLLILFFTILCNGLVLL